MPFKVLFEIRNKCQMTVTTCDRQYAYLKYNEYFNKDPCTKFTRTVTPINLTGPEKFLYMTYQVMESMRNYFDNKDRVEKDEEEKLRKEMFELLKQLDLRIVEGRYYLQSHPKSQIDEDALAFFLTVESWRKVMKQYYAYKKQKDREFSVESRLKNERYDYEKIINKHIQKNIGL